MVLDSSAIVAVLLKEPGYERLTAAMERADSIVVGAPTLLESSMVLTSAIGQDARPLILSFLRGIEAQVVPFGEEHANAAATAYLRFGGKRHPAGLNFGDCMSYAVAAVAGMPLLFKGKDFERTDIERA